MHHAKTGVQLHGFAPTAVMQNRHCTNEF